MKIFFIIIISVFFSFADSQDTTKKAITIDTIKKAIVLDSTMDTLKIPQSDLFKKKLLIAGAFSAVIPGGGQFYTGNYVKSGVFFSFEAILGLVSYNRYLLGKDLNKGSIIFHDSLERLSGRFKIDTSKTGDSISFDTTFLSLQYQMRYDYNQFLVRENRYFMYQILSLMGGLYYWNILDALKNTKFFMNDISKNPSTAGWLSTIPCLGLGQFYNDELSKAGMVFMAQTTMAYMVFNYNELMRICEDHIQTINDPKKRESKDPCAAELKSSWDSKRNDAFRNRNMWLWYSIGFYLYQIFDAVVDAHLHDSKLKMRLEPDLEPEKKKIGLNVNVPF
jgi:hypothetical protein